MIRIVIYARVSTVEQVDGYSIDAQIETCRAWANTQSYEVIRVFVEPGVSAKTDKRPAFQEMIEFVCLRDDIDGVLFHKVDRFARNLFDLLRYKDKLNQHNVRLLSATEPYINDDSPETTLMLTILGAFSEYRSYLIGLDAKNGINQALEGGQYPGAKVPLGYIRIGEKRHSKIEIDPDYAPAILDGFRELATGGFDLIGWTKEAMTRGYKNREGLPVSKTSWNRIFRSNFYIGLFDWSDKTYQGNHQPLISQDLWCDVQKVLDSRNSGGKQEKHFWLLKGLLWSTVHKRTMHGNAGSNHRYYRAIGRGKRKREHRINADIAEKQVIDLLNSLCCVSRGIPAPDHWLIAMLSVPNLGLMWPQLVTQDDKREFLNLVFLENSLHVDELNNITIDLLKPGFERI